MAEQQGNQKSAVERIPVVTAFLWDGRRVLLALRSERVSTFPGHWAGISGYLEGDDPAAWAMVEIEEETGLRRSQLTLRRAGQPLEASARQSRRVFVVHPFLFSVPESAAVRADWEAKRLEWVDVDEMLGRRRQPVVPRLYDAFDRVWPPWPAKQALAPNRDLAVRWLRADRQRGAGTLARAAAEEFVKLLRLCPDREFDALRAELARAAAMLGAVRPAMAAPANLMEDARRALADAAGRTDALEAVQRLIDRSAAAEQALAQRVAQRIRPGNCVMTVSYSSTVQRALRTAADRLGRVYVAESRPLLEGRRLATELAQAGIPVTLLTEAQVDLLMPRVDLVVLGADTIVPGRGAMNKVGSTLLALAARRRGKPVLVAAESLKRLRRIPAETAPSESGAAAEVWPDAPAGVEIANVYFELVPDELVTEYLDETAAEPP